jgi:hypothetical protein
MMARMNNNTNNNEFRNNIISSLRFPFLFVHSCNRIKTPSEWRKMLWKQQNNSKKGIEWSGGVIAQPKTLLD